MGGGYHTRLAEQLRNTKVGDLSRVILRSHMLGRFENFSLHSLTGFRLSPHRSRNRSYLCCEDVKLEKDALSGPFLPQPGGPVRTLVLRTRGP